MTTEEKNKKTLSGVVVSDKMDQTVIVKVDRYVKHPKYQKFIKKSKRYAVHNTENANKIGDKVEIMEIKPISKTKRFTIVK
jgi:small subunit ribosomal protein S17